MKTKSRILISQEERAIIKEMYDNDISVAQIARELNRPERSIYYELQRGYTGQLDRNGRKEYDPILAAKNRKQLTAKERAEKILSQLLEQDD